MSILNLRKLVLKIKKTKEKKEKEEKEKEKEEKEREMKALKRNFYLFATKIIARLEKRGAIYVSDVDGSAEFLFFKELIEFGMIRDFMFYLEENGLKVEEQRDFRGNDLCKTFLGYCIALP